MLPEDCGLSVQPLPKFVSRGGEKLEAALFHWKIDVRDKICLDVGASTGGFSDCLLQNGAKKIYCVDVGHGQLHPKIRNDARVASFENTHFLRWDPVWPKDEAPSLAVVDVSFISLEKILFRMYEVGSPALSVLALIKPQFEVEPRFAVKGIVSDSEAREEAILGILERARDAGFKILGRYPCPVFGTKGNQEEWGYFKKEP